MGLYRPETFDEFKGNTKLVNLIRSRIMSGDFPQASLFFGDEGVGKTTLIKLIAKALNCESETVKPCGQCKSCQEITDRVIRKNLDTSNVKTFRMSVDGGIDAAKSVREYLNTNMMARGVRVIDLEECHRMSNAAQDVLLSDIEYLPKNVYVVASTTDIGGLQKTFLSRFVPFTLNRPTQKEIIELLSIEAGRRNLQVQAPNLVFEMIAEWSDNKPRMALKALEAFGSHNQITMEDVKSFVSFLDTKYVLPILTSLNGSITQGIKAINDLPLDANSYNSLLTILVETIKVAKHQKFTKFSSEDKALIGKVVEGMDINLLLRFLYEVADISEFSRAKMLAAFLRVHPDVARIETPDASLLVEEGRVRANNTNEAFAPEAPKVPTIEELMRQSKRVE